MTDKVWLSIENWNSPKAPVLIRRNRYRLLLVIEKVALVELSRQV